MAFMVLGGFHDFDTGAGTTRLCGTGLPRRRGDWGVIAERLLSRRRTQAAPGIAHLLVMDFGRVVRGVEAERLHVEPAGGGEQRIGGDNAVALRANQPRACRQ